MKDSIDVSGTLKECTTDRIRTVWWAEIDGRIFVNSTGHPFFYRKADLIRSLKQSKVGDLVHTFTSNFLEFFESENSYISSSFKKKKVFDKFWNNLVGEDNNSRVIIRHYEIPLVLTNKELLRMLGEEAES